MFTTYAQNFEDVMLWRALEHIERGFYVDIGANDPVVDSVSKAFYDRGWRGVHVEPVPEYAQLLRDARPDEAVIERAVGAEAGEMTFHVIPGTGLSSLSEETARAAVALRGYEHVAITVSVVTLDELLAPYAGLDIHWLKIDVEGSEHDVLRGWNTRRDRPWIMVVEATRPNSQEECHAEWEPIVLAADYQFVYFDGLSRFYVSKEHCELAKSFSTPPNVFDEFHRYDVVAARAERDEIARQCNELRHRLDETQTQLEVARQQLAVTEEASVKRQHLLEQAEIDKAHLASEIARLDAERNHFAVDNAHLTAAKTQLLIDNTHLKSERARLDAERNHLAAESAQLTAARTQLSIDNAYLESERARLEAERNHLAAENADLTAATTQLSIDNAQSTAQLDQTRCELQSSQSELRDLREEITSGNVHAHEVEHVVADLRDALAQMHNSTSWRLTAPLRGLKRMISRP